MDDYKQVLHAIPMEALQDPSALQEISRDLEAKLTEQKLDILRQQGRERLLGTVFASGSLGFNAFISTFYIYAEEGSFVAFLLFLQISLLSVTYGMFKVLHTSTDDDTLETLESHLEKLQAGSSPEERSEAIVQMYIAELFQDLTLHFKVARIFDFATEADQSLILNHVKVLYRTLGEERISYAKVARQTSAMRKDITLMMRRWQAPPESVFFFLQTLTRITEIAETLAEVEE